MVTVYIKGNITIEDVYGCYFSIQINNKEYYRANNIDAAVALANHL